MTPMIDVVFQLLIFFVCTTSFRAVEESLPTRLSAPGGVSSAALAQPELADLEEVVVRVGWQGGRAQWQVNQRPLATWTEVRSLLDSLAQVQTNLPVILDVDAAAPIGAAIDLYDLCRVLGFERIQFATSAQP